MDVFERHNLKQQFIMTQWRALTAHTILPVCTEFACFSHVCVFVRFLWVNCLDWLFILNIGAVTNCQPVRSVNWD